MKLLDHSQTQGREPLQSLAHRLPALAGDHVTAFYVRPEKLTLELVHYVKPDAYEQRAEVLLGHMLEKRADVVMESMHPALAKSWTSEKILEDVEKVCPRPRALRRVFAGQVAELAPHAPRALENMTLRGNARPL